MILPLEQQICSLELAKRLKELGVKQESLFYWVNTHEPDNDAWKPIYNSYRKGYFKDLKESQPSAKDMEWCAAFTVAELGEMIPDHFHTQKSGVDFFIESKLPSIIAPGHYEFADTEADTRAKMLIYLLENKLVTL